MKTLCSLCDSSLEPARAGGLVADGICPSCLKDLLTRTRQPLQTFLDSLGVPILLLDEDARVRTANRKALELMRKDPATVENHYVGDAIECVHAKEPGGCGKTVHCKTCTVRRSVVDTYATGRPLVRVPAYADIAMFAEAKPIRYLISTEKIGELVMLRIDEASVGVSVGPQ